MKSKKTKQILTLLFLLIIFITVLILSFRKENNNIYKEEELTQEEIENQISEDIVNVEDTITINAYEYIMSVMSSPQYWGTNNLPLYNLDYEQEYSYKKLTEQNGTGWLLKDEDSAIFYRGSEGVLTINFSSNTANIKTWSNVYMSDENNSLDFDATEYKFDFNKNTYKYIAPYGEKKNNHQYDYQIVLSNRVVKPQTEEEFRESGDLFDERFIVKDIILHYEEIFKKAGCPLLNQPKGTLASYKNKMITVEKPNDDGLIHAIWKQEGFSWDWDSRQDLMWLDDYREIFNKEAPKNSEIEKINWNGQNKGLATYSSLFLVLVNKENCTYKYVDKNPNTATLFLKLDEYFDAEAGAFATYFLMPMTKLVYGYNGVYFYDANKLPNSGGSYNFKFNTKVDFLNNLKYPKDSSSSSILTIHKDGDIPVSLVAIEGDECNSLNNHMFLRMKQIANHYGKEFPYADDYMFNFYIYYNATAQRLLGLR